MSSDSNVRSRVDERESAALRHCAVDASKMSTCPLVTMNPFVPSTTGAGPLVLVRGAESVAVDHAPVALSVG